MAKPSSLHSRPTLSKPTISLLPGMTAEAELVPGVTVELLTFRSLLVETRLNQLNSIRPQFRYVHRRTGETTFIMPNAYKQALDAAIRSSVPVESDWEQERLWTDVEDSFALVDGSTLGYRFEDRDDYPLDVRALREYWTHFTDTDVPIETRFEAFQLFVSTRLINEGWRVYNATRDTSMAAAAGLRDAGAEESGDPNASSGGSAPSPSS